MTASAPMDLGTVMGVWAHPDDETYLAAGLFAHAVDLGSRVVDVTATRGEGGSPRWARVLGSLGTKSVFARPRPANTLRPSQPVARLWEVLSVESAVPLLSRAWVLVILDLLVVLASYFGALVLRFGGSVPEQYWSRAATIVPVIAGAYVLINLLFRLYSSDPTIGRAALAGLVGVVLVISANLFLERNLPLSVALLAALGSGIGFVGIRLASRRHHREAGV